MEKRNIMSYRCYCDYRYDYYVYIYIYTYIYIYIYIHILMYVLLLLSLVRAKHYTPEDSRARRCAAVPTPPA